MQNHFGNVHTAGYIFIAITRALEITTIQLKNICLLLIQTVWGNFVGARSLISYEFNKSYNLGQIY